MRPPVQITQHGIVAECIIRFMTMLPWEPHGRACVAQIWKHIRSHVKGCTCTCISVDAGYYMHMLITCGNNTKKIIHLSMCLIDRATAR